MNVEALRHQSDSVLSYALSDRTVRIVLRTMRDDPDISGIYLVHSPKYSFQRRRKETLITLVESDETFDYHYIDIRLPDLRFAYIFRIVDSRGNSFYYSENGLTEDFDFANAFYDFFQVSYINPVDVVRVNGKFEGRVLYAIFVDRFRKSAENRNPRINQEWGTKVTPTSLMGGDLKGIEEKLPYLKRLGVGGLYLTPVFQSPSNHKYDCTDYYTVSSDFGTDEDLRRLIEKAHEEDILIVLDMVFNHMSSDHPFFQDVVRRGKESPYWDFFWIHGDRVDMERGNYEMFASCKTHPKINLNSPRAQEYFRDVLLHYKKEYGVDGFRLDVSDEVPLLFWERCRAALQEVEPDIMLIGENWHNSEKYLARNDCFTSVMNYPFTKETLRLFKGVITPRQYAAKLTGLLFRYPLNVDYNLLNLLDDHDTHRFLTEIGGDARKLEQALALLMFYPGLPMIYYGDEVGLEGGYDPDSRRCFPWDKREWNADLHGYVTRLIHLTAPFRKGRRTFSVEERDGIIEVRISKAKRTLKLLLNMTVEERSITAPEEVLLSRGYASGVLEPSGTAIYVEENHET